MTDIPQQWRFKWNGFEAWSDWVDHDQRAQQNKERLGWNTNGSYEFRDKPTEPPIRPDRGAGVYYVRGEGLTPQFYSYDPGVGYEKIAGTA